jgi:hypothetical protein
MMINPVFIDATSPIRINNANAAKGSHAISNNNYEH